MKMTLRRVRREQIQDTGTRIADRVVARERRLGGCGVGVGDEGVGDCAGVAVEFFEVAALGVFCHFERVDERLG